jgi:hypothetical protein
MVGEMGETAFTSITRVFTSRNGENSSGPAEPLKFPPRYWKFAVRLRPRLRTLRTSGVASL